LTKRERKCSPIHEICENHIVKSVAGEPNCLRSVTSPFMLREVLPKREFSSHVGKIMRKMFYGHSVWS